MIQAARPPSFSSVFLDIIGMNLLALGNGKPATGCGSGVPFRDRRFFLFETGGITSAGLECFPDYLETLRAYGSFMFLHHLLQSVFRQLFPGIGCVGIRLCLQIILKL